MMKYEFLDHPGDIKIRSFGKDLPELLQNSALGMMSFLYDIDEVKIDHREKIEIEAMDLDTLMIDWLSELLTFSDTNDSAYTEFEFEKCTDSHIVAKVGGGPAPAKDDIKAVTYSELDIKKKSEGYEAVVVYDI